MVCLAHQCIYLSSRSVFGHLLADPIIHLTECPHKTLVDLYRTINAIASAKLDWSGNSTNHFEAEHETKDCLR